MDTKSESRFFAKHECKGLVRELMPSLKHLRQSGFSFRQLAIVINQKQIESGKPKFHSFVLGECYEDVIADMIEENAMRFFESYERVRDVAAQFGHVMPSVFSKSEIEEAGIWPVLIACVTLDDDFLRAELSDDRVLRARDPRELARLLLEAGVWVDDVACADWREGDIAPLAGQVAALKMAMREGRGRV